MEKSFPAFRAFRFLPFRQQGLPLGSNGNGIHHFPLGVPGMHASSMNDDFRIGGVKIFIFQAAQLAAVNGIGKVRMKFLHIKTKRTPPRFLIRCEGNADFSVL